MSMYDLAWYNNLIQPHFTPASWLFSIVWSFLYLMIFISLIVFSQSEIRKKQTALFLFTIQVLLNFLWSPVFFGLHNILLALVIAIFMWIFILATIIAFWKYSKLASSLLIPYFLWVSFAIYLNYEFYRLNFI